MTAWAQSMRDTRRKSWSNHIIDTLENLRHPIVLYLRTYKHTFLATCFSCKRPSSGSFVCNVLFSGVLKQSFLDNIPLVYASGFIGSVHLHMPRHLAISVDKRKKQSVLYSPYFSATHRELKATGWSLGEKLADLTKTKNFFWLTEGIKMNGNSHELKCCRCFT
jgi:hypothetical protein